MYVTCGLFPHIQLPSHPKGGVEGLAGTAVAVPLSISLRLRCSRFTALWTRPHFLESPTRLCIPVFLLLFKLNLCGLE